MHQERSNLPINKNENALTLNKISLYYAFKQLYCKHTFIAIFYYLNQLHIIITFSLVTTYIALKRRK
jgi:hypothetical protein